MQIIDHSVRFPHTVLVVVLLCVLFGYLSLDRIPVQLKPSTENPEIKIDTTFRGAAPREVEDQVTNRIEEVVDGVEGIERITSVSREGASSIKLEFDWGVDKNRAMIDVINKLNQVADLPDDAEEPVVVSVNSDSREPIMFITMLSKTLTANELYEIATDSIEPRFRRVAGVSDMWLFGGEEREMQIRVNPEKMAARGIRIDELETSLRSENMNVRGGFIDEGTVRFNLRTTGRFRSSEDIGAMIVRRSEFGSVYLREIAEIGFGYKEQTTVLRVNGTPTVVFGILRKAGANVVTICRQLETEIDTINREFVHRGVDVRLDIPHSDVAYIDESINLAWQNLMIGAILAAAVLLIFLRSPRIVLVVALSIPVCIITVFIFLRFFDRSLNIISLAGLAFSSGMILDNSIVVIENIYRHLNEGKDPATAAREATTEVWGAVVTSTLTTLAVFIPIIVMQNETGQLFKDIAITISLAISLSLIASISLIPTLAALLCRATRPDVDSQASNARPRRTPLLVAGGNAITRAYMYVINGMIGHRPVKMLAKTAIILIVTALFFASLTMLPSAEYLPNGNRNLVFYFAKPLVGSNLEKTVSDVEPLERILANDERVDRFFTVFASEFQAIGVICKDEPGADGIPYTHERKLREFTAELFRIGRNIAGFEVLFPVQASIFRDPGKQLEIDIIGPDLERLRAIASDIEDRLRGNTAASVKFVRSSFTSGKPEVQVHIDRARSIPLGMRVSQVADMVEVLKAGRIVGTYDDEGDQIDLALYATTGRVSERRDLEDIPIVTPVGKTVRLADIANVVSTTGPTEINHVEKERAITLTVNLKDDVALEEAIGVITKDVLLPVNAELPTKYAARLSGSADKLAATIKAVAGSFVLAVLIVYLLMVALFRSVLYPLIILITIPLATSGAFAGISIAHAQSDGLIIFDVISMLGLIILSGIVVNNAILIIHQAINFRDSGLSPEESLIESCRTRLRPICMSVITSVLGMLPLAAGSGAGTELYRGLGWVMIGGILVSTIFTLFLVPALASLMMDIQAIGRRIRGTDIGSHTRL